MVTKVYRKDFYDGFCRFPGELCKKTRTRQTYLHEGREQGPAGHAEDPERRCTSLRHTPDPDPLTWLPPPKRRPRRRRRHSSQTSSGAEAAGKQVREEAAPTSEEPRRLHHRRADVSAARPRDLRRGGRGVMCRPDKYLLSPHAEANPPRLASSVSRSTCFSPPAAPPPPPQAVLEVGDRPSKCLSRSRTCRRRARRAPSRAARATRRRRAWNRKSLARRSPPPPAARLPVTPTGNWSSSASPPPRQNRRTRRVRYVANPVERRLRERRLRVHRRRIHRRARAGGVASRCERAL